MCSDAVCCYLMPAFPENSVRKRKFDSVFSHSTEVRDAWKNNNNSNEEERKEATSFHTV